MALGLRVGAALVTATGVGERSVASGLEESGTLAHALVVGHADADLAGGELSASAHAVGSDPGNFYLGDSAECECDQFAAVSPSAVC